MTSVLVFLPSNIQDLAPGYLTGKTNQCHVDKVNVFFVCGKIKDCEANNETHRTKVNIIGYCQRSDANEKEVLNHDKENWLVVWADATKPIIKEIKSEASIVHLTKHKLICVLYDMHSMVHAELLLNSQHHLHNDYFKLLANSIRTVAPVDANNQSAIQSVITSTIAHTVLGIFLYVSSFLGTFFSSLSPILKYSSLGLHFVAYINSISWTLRSVIEQKKLTLKIGNFLLAKIVDICCGMFLLYWLMPVLTSSSLAHRLLSAANDVVTALQELPIWLMGVPAGVKLNHAFNTMLGKFFLYHINLWWTFLVVAKPVLELVFQIFLYFGQLGITFQMSILTDLLALVSFHVYCIYVYAARLYYLQLYGLVALFRLFLGKKRNPLRERIDSCRYSTDQLFMGTLAFTILLFLLPTTLMYYVVFTSLRVAMVGLGGLLARIRYLIEVLPLYATILWFLKSATVGSLYTWKTECTNVSICSCKRNLARTCTELIRLSSCGGGRRGHVCVKTRQVHVALVKHWLGGGQKEQSCGNMDRARGGAQGTRLNLLSSGSDRVGRMLIHTGRNSARSAHKTLMRSQCHTRGSAMEVTTSRCKGSNGKSTSKGDCKCASVCCF